MDAEELRGRIAAVRENIAAAARQAGRAPEEITLCAATKVQTDDTIRAAVAAGITVCGENRVQELTAHLAAGAYGPAVSEHMLAILLAIYKRLPDYRDGQKDHRWKDLGPVEGTDQALYAPREEWTHTSEITGETRVFLPGGELILRRGTTVLHADYYGYQDLPDHLDAFVRTLNSL